MRRTSAERQRPTILQISLIALAIIGAAPRLAHADRVAHGPARSQFFQAVRAAITFGHVRFEERFDYAMPPVAGTYRLEILPGRHVHASWALQKRVKGRFRYVEGPVTSQGTAPAGLLQAIALNLLIPGVIPVRAHPTVGLLLLEQYRVTHVSFSIHTKASSEIILVRGRGYPWQCAISCGASPYIPQSRISEEYVYTGRLVMDARTGLPTRYSSTLSFQGHVDPGQNGRFTYPTR